MKYRGIAQLVEQRSPKPRAVGSSPTAPAIFAAMAQVVEHVLGKDEVTGSNPVSSSNSKTFVFGVFFFLPNIKQTHINEWENPFVFVKVYKKYIFFDITCVIIFI